MGGGDDTVRGAPPGVTARALTDLLERIADVPEEEQGAAWAATLRPWLHGWVYEVRTGRLKDLVTRTADDLPHEVHRYDLDGIGAPALVRIGPPKRRFAPRSVALEHATPLRGPHVLA